MKITHINYSLSGGSGQVAQNLVNYQQRIKNIHSQLVYRIRGQLRKNYFADPGTLLLTIVDNYIIKKVNSQVLLSVLRNRQQKKIFNRIRQNNEILHLHWINGILSYENIKTLVNDKRKIIWTLHDMEFFTGGCHHALSCQQYETGCEKCPITKLAGSRLVKKNYENKFSFMDWKKITFIVPSRWMLEKFIKNPYLQECHVQVIPNSVNKIYFEYKKSNNYRKIIGISDSSYVLGFISTWIMNPLKGFDELKKTLEELVKVTRKDLTLVVIGRSSTNIEISGVKVINMGEISDPSKLCKIYSTLDLNISFSKAESFGLTIAELMAMGIPSLAISGTACDELIEHQSNGVLCNSGGEAVVILKRIVEGEIRFMDSSEIKAKAYEMLNPRKINEQYNKLYRGIN
jgi:glycosyltransferase involved in cell wall biosynthesis